MEEIRTIVSNILCEFIKAAPKESRAKQLEKTLYRARREGHPKEVTRYILDRIELELKVEALQKLHKIQYD